MDPPCCSSTTVSIQQITTVLFRSIDTVATIRRVLQPAGGKGEDFLSSKWLETADEPTLKHCQEERNRSNVFTPDDQQPQQTTSPKPPGGQSHGIFGGEAPEEPLRTSTKVWIETENGQTDGQTAFGKAVF